jgi:hypothetical protein
MMEILSWKRSVVIGAKFISDDVYRRDRANESATFSDEPARLSNESARFLGDPISGAARRTERWIAASLHSSQ